MASQQQNPLPPLTSEDRAALRQSIERDGILVPVIVSAGPAMQGEIVDGFNRREIWVDDLKRKVSELPSISKRFNSEAEFRIAQIDANLRRRQLTLVQRVKLAMAREPWEKRLAADRMRAGKPLESSLQGSKGGVRATAVAAEAVGLKRDTYEHARFVLEKAPREIKKQFEAGALSVDRAYKETRRELGLDSRAIVATAISKRFGKMPSGSYGALVIVPPWRLSTKTFEAGRIVPAELGALNLTTVAGKDAVIAVVVPARWLREALELVVHGWSASIVTVIAKMRHAGIEAAAVRERAEFVILATLGKPQLPFTARENVVDTDLQLFALLDELVPNRPGIVMFASTNRAGWDAWDPEIK